MSYSYPRIFFSNISSVFTVDSNSSLWNQPYHCTSLQAANTDASCNPVRHFIHTWRTLGPFNIHTAVDPFQPFPVSHPFHVFNNIYSCTISYIVVNWLLLKQRRFSSSLVESMKSFLLQTEHCPTCRKLHKGRYSILGSVQYVFPSEFCIIVHTKTN